MLKAPLAALALIATAAPAMAQSNLALALNGPVPQATTTNRTCAQIQGLVARYGKTVLVHSARGFDDRSVISALATFGNHTQDRVVLDQRYCLPRQDTTPIYVPTRDVAQCFAGYTCSEGSSSWGRGRGH